MMQGWKTYDCSDLEQHRLFLEELQVYLHPSDLTAQQGFRTTFSARYMSHGYIARAGYGPAVSISKTANEWSWNHVISMPVSGSIRSDLDGVSRISNSDHFVLRPPASPHSFETTADTDELFLAIDPDYLKTFCANLPGTSGARADQICSGPVTEFTPWPGLAHRRQSGTRQHRISTQWCQPIQV